MAIRILIADDHGIFRNGLRALLEKESDIEVVGEAGNGFDTLRAANDSGVDLVLLDLSMPGISGTAVARALRTARPHLAIVVVTVHEEEYYLKGLLEIGARGFVVKRSTAKVLLKAIRCAYLGKTYIDPLLGGRAGPDEARQLRTRDLPCRRLTRREREVCLLLAYGHTNGEIAEKLFISDRTVESHRMNILAKLGLRSRAELVRFAIDNGIFELS